MEEEAGLVVAGGPGGGEGEAGAVEGAEGDGAAGEEGVGGRVEAVVMLA